MARRIPRWLQDRLDLWFRTLCHQRLILIPLIVVTYNICFLFIFLPLLFPSAGIYLAVNWLIGDMPNPIGGLVLSLLTLSITAIVLIIVSSIYADEVARAAYHQHWIEGEDMCPHCGYLKPGMRDADCSECGQNPSIAARDIGKKVSKRHERIIERRKNNELTHATRLLVIGYPTLITALWFCFQPSKFWPKVFLGYLIGATAMQYLFVLVDRHTPSPP